MKGLITMDVPGTYEKPSRSDIKNMRNIVKPYTEFRFNKGLILYNKVKKEYQITFFGKIDPTDVKILKQVGYEFTYENTPGLTLTLLTRSIFICRSFLLLIKLFYILFSRSSKKEEDLDDLKFKFYKL